MRRKQHYAWFFIFPGLILLLMFTVLAAILAFCFSFMDFNLLRPQDASFIGTDNYIRLFKDTSFLKAMKNTFYFAVIVVPYQVGLAFGLALLVSVIAILWTFIYNPNPTQGLLNAVFAKAGLPSCDFLRSADTAMNSIIFMSGWHGAGYQMMILLAGLQAIPEDLYEATSIDGAGAIKKFVYITVPGIKNVLVFVVMMTTISAMKLFTQPYIMTNGGPKESTMTLTYYLYRQGFQYRNMGYASAVSVIFFVVVVGISTGIKKIMKAR